VTLRWRTAPAVLQFDPSFVGTHTVDLEEGPRMCRTFRDEQDGCIKVVMKP
jgi:hypothetical protein